VLEKVIDSEVLVITTPTWLGRPSSVAQRVLERLDALLSETDDEGKGWSHSTAAAAAANLVGAARALAKSPIGPPPSGD
jgi:multimeric flavodoxin WrbA